MDGDHRLRLLAVGDARVRDGSRVVDEKVKESPPEYSLEIRRGIQESWSIGYLYPDPDWLARDSKGSEYRWRITGKNRDGFPTADDPPDGLTWIVDVPASDERPEKGHYETAEGETIEPGYLHTGSLDLRWWNGSCDFSLRGPAAIVRASLPGESIDLTSFNAPGYIGAVVSCQRSVDAVLGEYVTLEGFIERAPE